MQPPPLTAGLQFIQRHTFRVLTTLVMVGWCTALTTYTLHLQHSCAPLLPHSIPDRCSPKTAQARPKSTTQFEKITDHLLPAQLPKTIRIDWPQRQPVKVLPKRLRQVINHTTDNLPTPTITEPHKIEPTITNQPTQLKQTRLNPKQISRNEAIAIVTGSAALLGLAVIGVPIIVATGAGAAIWYAARTIVSTAL